jgi:hypothetical protein
VWGRGCRREGDAGEREKIREETCGREGERKKVIFFFKVKVRNIVLMIWEMVKNLRESIVVYICIGKKKVVWIPKLKKNGWVAVVSALSRNRRLFYNLYHSHMGF